MTSNLIQFKTMYARVLNLCKVISVLQHILCNIQFIRLESNQTHFILIYSYIAMTSTDHSIGSQKFKSSPSNS